MILLSKCIENKFSSKKGNTNNLHKRRIANDFCLKNALEIVYQQKWFYFENSLYIYIYIVLFGPVKPELGVIPSGPKKNKNKKHSTVNI